MKRKILFVALGMVATAVPLRVEALAPTHPVDLCEGTGVLKVPPLPARLEAANCSLEGRVVDVGGVTLTVPEPGVSVEFIGEPGGAALHHDEDGTVRAEEHGEGHQVDSSPTTTPTGCATSTASALTGAKLYSNFAWWYNPSGQPTFANGTAQAALQASAANVDNGFTNCGALGVPANSSQSFSGTTTRTPNVGSAGCGTRDTYNVTGFGSALSYTTLGRACIWSANDASPRRVLEGDILFRASTNWWNGTPGCVPSPISPDLEAYDLQGVATHEFGHVFGLSHVSESGTSGALTMSPQIGQCSVEERTLGHGDLNGLFALYGRL